LRRLTLTPTGIQGVALGVQRVKRAGLSVLLERLAKPSTSSTKRAARKKYHIRLKERDVIVRKNIERMQHKKFVSI